jgi:iron complex outermembrane receptor protein
MKHKLKSNQKLQKLAWALAAQPLLAGFVCAQNLAPISGAASTTTAASGELEEVIVTAEKHETTKQKTAIAMSVVDAQTIQQNSVGSLKDLSSILPSVSFAQQNASVTLGIRGVVSRDSSNPAVALSYDDFYTQAADGLNMSMFDIQRVEVLRGPQGTLLGRNATAGAVNIITAKPTDTFSAYLSQEYGDYNTHNTTGMLNMPVNDKIQVRLAFQTRNHDGYRKNPVGQAGDDENSQAGRAEVAFEPTDRWNALLTLESAHVNDVGPVVQAVPLQYLANGNVDFSKPSIPGDGKTFDSPYGGFEKGQTDTIRWNTSYAFDLGTLTYLGGYRYMNYHRMNTLGGQYGTPVQNLTYNAQEGIRTWNNELRLTSKEGERLFWQLGAFQFYENNNNTTYFNDFTGTDLTKNPVYLFKYRYPHQQLKSWAVFGQASYQLTDTLKLEVGARDTHDTVSNDGTALLTSLGAYESTGAINYYSSPAAGEYSSSKGTYHGALDWQVAAANLLYAKYDTGYKAGGFANGTNGNYYYQPETNTAYEIGSKNHFWGNTIELNVDAFDYEYVNQQVQTYNATIASNQTVNAGKSKYYGVEFEGAVLLTQSDRLDGYLAYIHSKYTDLAIANGTSNLQLAGNTPPQSPRGTIELGYQHDFDVFNGTLTPRLQTHYETASYFTIYNYGADEQKAYHRSDLLLTYKPESKSWALEGYVRNIEDKLILAGAKDPSTFYRAVDYQYQPPRTFGAKFTYYWGGQGR